VSKNRLNMMIAVVAMVVVAVGGFFLGVQPQLARAASDKDQQTSVDQTNTTNLGELDRLKKQSETLPSMKEQLAKLEKSMPSTASMSAFYDELNSVAGSTAVKVSSITTADAIAYTPPASVSDTSTGSATASPSATPSATAAPTAAATPTIPQAETNPAITASNLSMIPVSVAVTGSFDQALAFVKGVQNGDRLFLVNAVSSTASAAASDGSSASGTTWTFGGYVYVLDTAATASPSASATPSAG
jgi:Tfp pilus assembly protein PilO